VSRTELDRRVSGRTATTLSATARVGRVDGQTATLSPNPFKQNPDA